MSGCALPILPESAPFPAEHIRALNAVMARDQRRAAPLARGLSRGLPRRDRQARGAAGGGAGRWPRQDPAHDPVRDRIRQRRGGRGRCEEGGGQAGLRRAGCVDMAETDPGRDRQGRAPAGDRQHLGRGRSARARGRVLPGADGRGRAALRGRAVRGAGARRFQLRQLLRDRPADRRAPGSARRQADRAAGRLRPRLRGAGGGVDQGRARRSSRIVEPSRSLPASGGRRAAR